jgi:hypothetical protein
LSLHLDATAISALGARTTLTQQAEGPTYGGDHVRNHVDRVTKATSVAAVAASLVVWWPAFTLGTYGVVFFEQTLSLWAASTAVFLVSLTAGRRDRVSWPRRLTLLLPSLWLLVSIVVPPSADTTTSRALFLMSVALTLVGIPYLAALLLRVSIAGYEQLPSRRRLVAAAVVAAVAIGAFVLGQINNRFLTCNDFTVSGNYAPPGCTESQGHLGL